MLDCSLMLTEGHIISLVCFHLYICKIVLLHLWSTPPSKGAQEITELVYFF